MLLGVGSDIINIERIQRVLNKFGDRFCYRVLTETERQHAYGKRQVAGIFAKRWAAKEACSKALGTGLRMRIAWKSISVNNLSTGQPMMHVTGWALHRLKEMTPPGYQSKIYVSLTDDHPFAQATVVIEALPVI